MQISASRLEPGDLQQRSAIGRVDQNLVPIDAHVCNDAHFAIRAEKLSGEIDSYSLRASDRNADVLDYGAPASPFILNLKGRWLHRLPSLRSGNVIAGPCVIGPTGQQQNYSFYSAVLRHRVSAITGLCGSAALMCGKAPPFRRPLSFFSEAAPR